MRAFLCLNALRSRRAENIHTARTLFVYASNCQNRQDLHRRQCRICDQICDFFFLFFFFLPSLLLRRLNQTDQSIHMPIITSSPTTEARDNANTRKGGRPSMCSVTCGVRCKRIRDPRFTVIDVVAWHALAWASNATNEVASPCNVCVLCILDNEYERPWGYKIYAPPCYSPLLLFFFFSSLIWQSMNALVNE